VSGHRLSVILDAERVYLRVHCDEPKEANCRLACAEDCTAESYPCGHKLIDAGWCNAAEWFDASGGAEEFAWPNDPIPLHDQMPVDVYWDGALWRWRPL
jgi:hypothetical protein